MMSKFSLKKYTIALLVCFLSFLGIANAQDVTLSLGNMYPLPKGFKENFVCKFEDGSTNGGSNPFKLESKADGSWQVTYTTVQTSEVRKNVVCTYNDPEDGSEKTDKYTFITDLLYSDNYTVILSDDNGYVGDIGTKINLGSIVEVGTLKATGVLADADKYFDLNCSGSSCKASLNSQGRDMVNRGAGFKAEVRIKFKKSGEEIPQYAVVTLIVNIKQTTKAYPGDVGTCSFDSEWSSEQTEDKHSGQIYRFHSTESDHALLPDCKAKNELPAIFKGWVTGYDTGDHITAIGNCKNALPKNSPVEAGASYAACYELSANIVQLSFGAGSLTSEDQTKWTSHRHAAYEEYLTSQGGNPNFATGYYYMTTDATETITLPSELVFSDWEEGRVLIEWVHQKTGKTVAPGTAVPVAGSNVYIANISGVSYGTKNRNKTIYVGESNILSDSAAGYGTLCKSADSSKVEASFENGKCTITGKAKTDSGSTVDVTLVTDSGDIVFKVTVLDSVGQNQGGDSEFIIDTTPNIIIGENEEGTELVSGSMCTEFRISLNSSLKIGTIKSNGERLLSSLYKVTPLGDCDTDSKYVSLCLDPGLQGPSGHLYRLETTLDSDHPLNKLMQQIVDRNEELHGTVNMDVFGDLNSSERVSAHVASRSVAMKSNISAGYDESNVKYRTAHNAYKNIANDISSFDDEGDVRGAITRYLNIEKSGVEDGVVDLLTKFSDQTADVTDYDKMKVDFDHKDAEPNGSNGYKIIYTGKITLPAGIEATGLEPCTANATLGISCGASSFEPAGQIGEGADAQHVYSYKVEMIVNNATTVKLPATEEEERSISYRMKVSANAFVKNVGVATPVVGDRLQQMLVFDLGEPDVYVYFPPLLDRICSMGLPAVDPGNCTDADHCGAPFNRQLFKQAGCCDELTDESSSSYIVDAVCNGVCTSSTFVEVCEYNAKTVGNADLYEINEGTYKDFENGTEQQDYHQCVVNVTDRYNTSGGLSSNESFKRLDDVGQIRNVDTYENNRYCQVTCKEDWQISMDAFGNYVGQNAVAAGSYFQIVNNDVFMSGQRTCFTSFIDYDGYMKKMVELSEKLIKQYNIYSEASHIWNHLDKQSYNSDWVTPTARCKGGTCDTTTCNCCSGSGCGEDGTSCCDSTVDGYTCDEQEWTVSIKIPLNDDVFNGGNGTGKYSRYDFEKKDENTIIEPTSDSESYEDKSLTYGFNAYEDCSCGCSSSSSTGYDDELSSMSFNEGGGSISASNSEAGISVSWDTTSAGAVSSQGPGMYEAAKKHWMEELENVMTTAIGEMEDLKSEIEARSQEMFDCQHFIQYNLSDDSESRSGKVKVDDYNGTLFGSERDATQIDTSFEPKAAYTYDEKAFMTILGKDNVLEMYDFKNHKLYGGTFESFKSSNAYDDATEEIHKVEVKDGNGTVSVDLNGDGEPDMFELARNAMETVYYDPDEIWAPDSDASRKYEGGRTVTVDSEGDGSYSTYGSSDFEEKYITFCTIAKDMDGKDRNNNHAIEDIGNSFEWKADKGGCYKYKLKYVKAHYIKNSIKNSSFYKNKGYWFNRGSDVKEHGDTLVDALQNANNASNRDVNYSTDQAELDRWSLLGTYNVFPISMTTPRNLYQYTYTFGDIGSYADGDLGRIMGKDKSIISLNHRTCFYEVYEEICLCCGDTINVHVDGDEEDKTEPFLNSTSAYNYNKSDTDKIISNTDGSISFATSSVALGDVYKDTEVADNWNNTAPFTYNGNNHLATDKGAKLLEEIQALGEEVYNEEPEYSFYLDTSTLAAIREYNDSYGYDVNYNNLKVYGRYSIVPIETCSSNPTGCTWTTDDETMNNTIINFQHYGSTFLEEVLPSMGTNVVLGKTLSKNTADDNVCVVSSSQVGNHSNILTKMAVGTGAGNGCRWIDYIEDMEAVKSNAASGTDIRNNKVDPASGRVERYYRMAFK